MIIDLTVWCDVSCVVIHDRPAFYLCNTPLLSLYHSVHRAPGVRHGIYRNALESANQNIETSRR